MPFGEKLIENIDAEFFYNPMKGEIIESFEYQLFDKFGNSGFFCTEAILKDSLSTFKIHIPTGTEAIWVLPIVNKTCFTGGMSYKMFYLYDKTGKMSSYSWNSRVQDAYLQSQSFESKHQMACK